MKTKKWLCILAGIIILSGCISVACEINWYFNPKVMISYRVQESEDLYLSMPSYSIETRSHFGYAPKYDEEMREWWIPTNEMEVRLHTEYVKPIHVSSNVVIEDGKTIITYTGTASLPSGEIVPIEEEFVLDFEVTK